MTTTRDLVYTGFMSLDGVFDSPGGSSEGHRNGGWVLQAEFVPEAFSLKDEELAETSALLFGRRSYEAFSAFWPGSAEHEPYRDIPKYVVSTTLGEDSIVDGWGPTTILRSLDEVAALKREAGGAIFVHGSTELAHSLADAGLIDRYNLLVFPVLIGPGKSAFGSAEHGTQRLQLRESATYPNGVTKLCYDVINAVHTPA
ncbi:dihydrofolate reductase family protein [Microtetraspora malaysiensis]|uniref:dihydrofolate reductase family protein n=1 Tax=Microtetraspora malaysiensis TaxID=161358 RepID=UPI003D8A6C9D